MTHVVFDMDGVLCDYDFERRMAVMAAALDLPAERIAQAIFQSGFDNEADIGQHTAESYLAGMADRLGVPVDASVWLEARRQSMTPDQAVIGLVQAIAGKVTNAMLTNNGPLLQQRIDDVFPPARQLFGDNALFSFQFGCGKDSPEVFRRLLQHLGAEPAATLFIDDWPSYLENARAVGLRTHLFRDADSLRGALAGHGLI